MKPISDMWPTQNGELVGSLDAARITLEHHGSVWVDVVILPAAEYASLRAALKRM